MSNAADVSPVKTILDAVGAALLEIRGPNNDEEEDAYRRAHEQTACLFQHGMIDRWCEEEGEPPPVPAEWNWNAEPLEPSDDWSEEDKTMFHRVIGDLCFLHSNDAGLNAAAANYRRALPSLVENESEEGVWGLARMFRACTYASYGLSVFLEHLGDLCWAKQQLPKVSRASRDEFELSFVEMFGRVTSGATILEDYEYTEDDCHEVLAIAIACLQSLLERADMLPYRKSIPWLALAWWGNSHSPTLVKWSYSHFDAETAPQLQLAILAKAVEVEDGAFYRHGGALSCSQYIDATREFSDSLAVDVYVELEDRRCIELLDARLASLSEEDYHDSDRAKSYIRRLRALHALGANAEWRMSAMTLVAWLGERVDAYWWEFAVETDAALEEVIADAGADPELLASAEEVRGKRAEHQKAERDLYSF